MKNVLEVITDGAAWLQRQGVESARLNLEHLLAKVLGCKRLELYMQFDRPLEEKFLTPLRELMKRRGKREPLQHLLGTVEFHGHEFLTDRRALIPRPETEELVQKIAGRYKGGLALPLPERILDAGTGSGVIGLSLALAFPAAHVVLTDVSDDALALAQENAAKLGLGADRVTFLKSNLFAALGGQTFDLIASNLPYIAAGEIPGLEPEVRDFDPHSALVGGTRGTELIEAFLTAAPAHCVPGTLIALEVGTGQTAHLSGCANAAGFAEIKAVNDYSGHDRFLFARAPGGVQPVAPPPPAEPAAASETPYSD